MTPHSSNGHLHSTNKTFTIFKIKLLRQNLSLFPLKQNWPLDYFFEQEVPNIIRIMSIYYLGMCNDKNMIFFRHKF